MKHARHKALRHSMVDLLSAVVGIGGMCQAATPEYSRDLSTWLEVPVPALEDSGEREVWDLASDYSELEWRAYLEGGKPMATLTIKSRDREWKRLPFKTHVEHFDEPTANWKVDDGWLTAFNYGEFGAALYWFSGDGKRHYRLSADHVVEFLEIGGLIYAIEGMDHMSLSCGSLIQIARARRSDRWQASRVLDLPWAPTAVALKKDGTMLIVLSNALVAVAPDHEIQTLIDEAPWENLYPTSAVLTSDETHLFLGMRQYIGDVDLASNRLHMLVPAKAFLNKLPEDTEQRLRRDYAPNRNQTFDRSARAQHLPHSLCDMTAENARDLSGTHVAPR